jgi:hypothetical protein
MLSGGMMTYYMYILQIFKNLNGRPRLDCVSSIQFCLRERLTGVAQRKTQCIIEGEMKGHFENFSLLDQFHHLNRKSRKGGQTAAETGDNHGGQKLKHHSQVFECTS